MTVSKKREINFTEGPYLWKIIWFALPIMATGLLQILFNAVDSSIVGKFVGDEALAGVSSTSTVFNLLVNLFMGLSVGANVLVAQFYGAKRQKDVEEVVHTSVLLSIIAGVIVLVLGFFFCKDLLLLMHSPEDVIDISALYLKIIFLGAPVNLLYNFSAAMMRAVGDTKRPMVFLAIACGLNIVLDLLFVLVFRWEVAGAAAATVISQAVAAVLTVIALVREKGVLHIDLKTLRIHGKKLSMILQIGIPAGLQSAVFTISNFVIQSSINSLGKIAVAGNGAGYQLEVLEYNTILAFYHSTLNFVGQNVGARKFERARKGMLVNVGISMLLGLVLSVGCFMFGRQLLRLFTDSEDAIEYGMKRLTIVVLPYLFVCSMESMSGAVRGLGAAITPTVVSLIGSCLFRLVWVYTVFSHYGTIESLYFVYPVTWVLTSVAHIISFIIIFRRMQVRLLNLPRPRHLHEKKESLQSAES